MFLQVFLVFGLREVSRVALARKLRWPECHPDTPRLRV